VNGLAAIARERPPDRRMLRCVRDVDHMSMDALSLLLVAGWLVASVLRVISEGRSRRKRR